jgi:hypothetical protein
MRQYLKFLMSLLVEIILKVKDGESCCCPDKAENMGFLPSTYLLTPQQFQKNTPTKNKIKTPNQ